MKGGWEYRYGFDIIRDSGRISEVSISGVSDAVDRVLLDPAAWQAVGKTRGWESDTRFAEATADGMSEIMIIAGEWKDKWHRFIDHRADGKTIEEALQAIS